MLLQSHSKPKCLANSLARTATALEFPVRLPYIIFKVYCDLLIVAILLFYVLIIPEFRC